MKDASGGEAVRKVGNVVVQRTVRNDKAHTGGVPRGRSIHGAIPTYEEEAKGNRKPLIVQKKNDSEVDNHDR